MDYSNPNDAWRPSDPDQYKDINEADRVAIIIKRILKLLLALVVTLLILFVFCGCTTPRAVEEHHHHHYEADTLAVKAQVDRHLQSWHQQIDSAWKERISQYFSQQQQTEQQHETITETVTETVDSLGRKIRQEQRTISRDISRELQTIEQTITREYELRLQVVTDSLSASWQQRYDSLSARVSQMDSTMVKKTPVADDNRPWYRKLWDRLQWLVIGIIVAAAAWFSRRWWLKKVQERVPWRVWYVAASNGDVIRGEECVTLAVYPDQGAFGARLVMFTASGQTRRLRDCCILRANDFILRV